MVLAMKNTEAFLLSFGVLATNALYLLVANQFIVGTITALLAGLAVLCWRLTRGRG